MICGSTSCSCRGARIGPIFLRPMDFDTVDRDFFACIDTKLFRHQVFHGLNARDVEFCVVWRCERRNRQQRQHHAEDHEC